MQRLFCSSAAILYVAMLTVCRAQSVSTPDIDPQWRQYVHIAHMSTLEWSVRDPFVVRASYQLFDLAGHPASSGNVEESWTSEGKSIRVVPAAVSGTTAPEPTGREEFLARQALASLVRPFPELAKRQDFALMPQPQMIPGAPLNCFALGAPDHALSAQKYCTDTDNHIVAIGGPLYMIERAAFRKYHDHEIPMDTKLSYEGRPALSLHVEELDPISPERPAFQESGNPQTTIPGQVIAGMIVKKKNPKYPGVARAAHISGSVVLHAIISKEGAITHLEPVASPDPVLTKSAMDAVQTWTYKPYLLNGQPTEVDTTITVNYNLGK